ncbi:unnamed protein product [Paramecium octaurelia]|uniref:Uncharacterized protein n=1 Tax=Paramecium octaurelia TaxID=43137 RepID=A0A8S1Y286_PAROT|nr:unnamed protein product [Paramecium octaurelia]
MQLNQIKSKKRRITPSEIYQLSLSQERYQIPKFLSLNQQNINKSQIYQILDQIGSGSYNTIFIAENKLHGGYYANEESTPRCKINQQGIGNAYEYESPSYSTSKRLLLYC